MPDQQSGGISVKAKKVEIGEDAVGGDKFVSTYNYGVASSQPRRAELPHQPYFFGREDELAQIADALDPESNGWGVLIDGPGGIGKTALAIRAGHLAPDKTYPAKIFLSAKVRELTPRGEQKLEDFMLPNYMTLLTELARELGDEGIERIDPNERVREVRRLLESSHALIIVDNLETFDESERDRLFQFLKRLPRSCKAIVTSRRRTDVAAEIIRLDRLKKDDALRLIAKLAERNRFLARAGEYERAELYEITKGNPLLIEWIAGQLGRPESQCRTIADACKYLENTPKDNAPLEYIFGDLLDTFTAHEKVVLASLSHFTLPAKMNWIARIAEMAQPATETALEDLSDRALVISDAQAESYVVPPLVAVFLRRRCPEAISSTGNRLIDSVLMLAVENGYEQYERYPVLEEEWPVIAAALPLFLQSDNDHLSRLCHALSRFLSSTGRWEDRLTLGLKEEERASSENDYVHAGWGAYNAGVVYFQRGQIKELRACAHRAKIYWANSSEREKAYALRLDGWEYRLEENYREAVKVFQEALDLWRTANADSHDVAIGLNNLAQVERKSGDYSAAERDYHEAVRIARDLKDSASEAHFTGNLAALALDRQDWSTAEELAKQALSLAETVGSKEVIAHNCRRLAKALAKQGRSQEGLPYAQHAVEIYTRLYSPDLAKAQAVLKECGG